MKKLIILILLVGVIFRLIISHGGNFIFNIDNGRDMVDVREMVVLHHPRLIGQTTSIDGVFYGPAWYYLLAVPFVISGGDPYASIILEIILWAVGGYFLLWMVNKFYGKVALVVVSCIWLASNFILLGSQYAFNPNPILFLTPFLIYSIWRYLETKKWWFNCIAWLLAGLFLHFEVTVGLFTPLVILGSILWTRKWSLFKEKAFYLGLLIFFLTLTPQIIFELRHNFFMTKSLLAYKSTSHSGVSTVFSERAPAILRSFYDTLLPTLMNFKIFVDVMLFIFAVVMGGLIMNKRSLDLVTKIALLVTIIPLVGLIPLKVDLLRWYLNASLIGGVILIGWSVSQLTKFGWGKIVAIILTGMVFTYTLSNMYGYIKASDGRVVGNSHLVTELKAVDYTYRVAGGKNFKVYIYIPSVYDWPYQYLYWWWGLKKYGYVPEEYAYAPGKPPIVNEKRKLDTGSHPASSGLIFLIKEADQIGQRHLWENQFKDLELIKSETVGPLIIETRKENNG